MKTWYFVIRGEIQMAPQMNETEVRDFLKGSMSVGDLDAEIDLEESEENF